MINMRIKKKKNTVKATKERWRGHFLIFELVLQRMKQIDTHWAPNLILKFHDPSLSPPLWFGKRCFVSFSPKIDATSSEDGIGKPLLPCLLLICDIIVFSEEKERGACSLLHWQFETVSFHACICKLLATWLL